jgi:hypothetical protein
VAQKLNLGFGAILNFFSVKTVILNCVIAVNEWFMNRTSVLYFARE